MSISPERRSGAMKKVIKGEELQLEILKLQGDMLVWLQFGAQQVPPLMEVYTKDMTKVSPTNRT